MQNIFAFVFTWQPTTKTNEFVPWLNASSNSETDRMETYYFPVVFHSESFYNRTFHCESELNREGTYCVVVSVCLHVMAFLFVSSTLMLFFWVWTV